MRSEHPQAMIKLSGDITIDDGQIIIKGLTQAEVIDEENPNRASTHWVFDQNTQLRFEIPDSMVQSYVYFHPRNREDTVCAIEGLRFMTAEEAIQLYLPQEAPSLMTAVLPGDNGFEVNDLRMLFGVGMQLRASGTNQFWRSPTVEENLLLANHSVWLHPLVAGLIRTNPTKVRILWDQMDNVPERLIASQQARIVGES